MENVRVGVIISAPFFKLSDSNASKLAEDPEFTIKPNFFPNNNAIFFSNSLTEGPSIKDKDLFFKTLVAAEISLLL